MELEIREGEQSDKGDLIEKGKKASEKRQEAFEFQMPAKENGENGNKAQSKWKGEKWAYQYGPQSMPISGTGVVETN